MSLKLERWQANDLIIFADELRQLSYRCQLETNLRFFSSLIGEAGPAKAGKLVCSFP